jgi:hypothetical protein
MATTYTLISSVTVGSGGAANIEFTSIPATYTDLVILSSLRTTTSEAFDGIRMTFNNTSANRSIKRFYGLGSGSPGTSSNSYMMGSQASTASNTSNTFGNGFCYIPNYTSSNYKSASSDEVSETNATTAVVEIDANLWSDTSAITSIQLVSENSANFVQYSTAYLYGISNA